MPPRRTRNVNLMQLAEHTGLSIAAVSSVLNGLSKERRISEESVKKVQDAARELGYVPNIFARRLSSHARGTSQALLAVVTAFEAGELRKLPGIVDNHRFSGAIIANTIEADDRFLAKAHIPYPVVTINRALPNCAAVLESSDTGRAAADILLKAGCKRCAVLTPATGTSTTAGRLGGFHAAVETATDRAPVDIIAGGRAEEDGYQAMRAHLKKFPDTDGLYAINDTLAIGAYHAIHESGRKIPKDIKVVGVGDHTASPYLTPPLTCVGASEEKLHAEAADLLLALFTGRETGAPHRIMPLQIVRRESTG